MGRRDLRVKEAKKTVDFALEVAAASWIDVETKLTHATINHEHELMIEGLGRPIRIATNREPADHLLALALDVIANDSKATLIVPSYRPHDVLASYQVFVDLGSGERPMAFDVLLDELNFARKGASFYSELLGRGRDLLALAREDGQRKAFKKGFRSCTWSMERLFGPSLLQGPRTGFGV